MKYKKHYKSRAFTLIELSVIILIIGIMISGTFIGTRIIAKSRLAAAESLARSSPVPGIKDNMLWLETSLSASIDSSQASDGAAVTAWYDQSSNAAKPLVVAVGTGPTYANTINHVHAIKFDGSTANYLQISDASFLNGTDYTIMVLEKRQSSASNNYFIGETSGSPNTSLALGYGSDSTVIHAQGNQSYATGASVSSYASSTDKPRQFTFVHSSTAGNSTYINGILAAQDATKTAHLSGITSLAIGKGYTGEIGEIAIYARALKPEERQPIEDYAGKKWTRSINRASAPSGSCVGYTITDSGCDLASATCSISQAGISATVAATSSSTSIACNQTNYSGSVSYTCISGTASVSGSCTPTIPCTLSLTGSTNTSSVASGATGSMTCNVTGYTGTVSYSCSNGTASYGGACACNTAGGYVESGGSCVLGSSCSTTAVTGVSTPTTVAHQASGSFICNGTNFSGTADVTYSCNNGTLSSVGTCACASGYSLSGSTCVLGGSCSVSGTGAPSADTTSVPGSTIFKFMTVGTYTFTCPATKSVQVLVVAGGGGGSGGAGGAGGSGGGAGGVIYNSSFSVTAPITVTVGSGGNGSASTGGSFPNLVGSNGENSLFSSSLTAIGGGGGGARQADTTPAPSGGSGGGGGISGSSKNGGTATSGQGYAGGNNSSSAPNYGGGGGGGAGGAGQNGSSTKGGNGGVGIQNSITGTATYYGGGGASSYYNSGGSNGTGGLGGGGNVGVAGTDGLGAGGGGAPSQDIAGSKGGSGVVIVRY